MNVDEYQPLGPNVLLEVINSSNVFKVVKLGKLSYRNRETLNLWPEGEWVSAGDIVQTSHSNIKFLMDDKGTTKEYVVVHDFEIKAKINKKEQSL